MTKRIEDLTAPLDGSAEFVERPDGARIHRVHAGHGLAVVLAHGYLLDSSVYSLVFGALVAAGHRVIAFDQRGHGRSSGGGRGFGSEAPSVILGLDGLRALSGAASDSLPRSTEAVAQ